MTFWGVGLAGLSKVRLSKVTRNEVRLRKFRKA